MNLDVTNANKKTIHLEFKTPVGCLINERGGEMISKCFHKHYLPPYGECHKCLSLNEHRVLYYDKDGRKNRRMEMENGEWKEKETTFRIINTNKTYTV